MACLAEDGMLIVDPGALVKSDEELRAIRVRPAGSHPQQPTVCVAQPAMELVLEVAAVDRISAGACARRITCLRHKILDDAMENAAIIVALEAKLDEVAAGERSLLAPELHVKGPDRRVQYHLAFGRGLRGVDSEGRHDSAAAQKNAVKVVPG